uniref:LGFP repeat-containing protein n=1 Tax=Geodermatophilus amargosae TaxID=1296565 RepID=UPI0034E039F6
VAGILETWIRQGYETGPLGYPVSNETATATGGSHNWFQGGAVYWSPSTGAHWLGGPILHAWIAQGFETGPLGYPASDPHPVPGGTAVDFQGGTLVVDGAGTVVRR